MMFGIPKGNIPLGEVRIIDIGKGNVKTLKRISAEAAEERQSSGARKIFVKGVKPDSDRIKMEDTKDSRVDARRFVDEQSEKSIEMITGLPNQKEMEILGYLAKSKKVLCFTEIELLAENGILLG